MTLIPYYSSPRLRPSLIHPITRGVPKLAQILSNLKIEIAAPTLKLTSTSTNHSLRLAHRGPWDFRPLEQPAGSAGSLYKFPRFSHPQRAVKMSAPEDLGDAHGDTNRGDLSGDLRSVLVTSVLNLEPLDEDLYR